MDKINKMNKIDEINGSEMNILKNIKNNLSIIIGSENNFTVD